MCATHSPPDEEDVLEELDELDVPLELGPPLLPPPVEDDDDDDELEDEPPLLGEHAPHITHNNSSTLARIKTPGMVGGVW
jgi:hypothetical protein